MRYVLLLIVLTLFMPLNLFAQTAKSPILGVWETERKEEESNIAHVKIDYCKEDPQQLCGHIVWTERKIDKETGKPPLDKNNPDEALQSRPIMGLKMLWGFTPANDELTKYDNGHVYSPTAGKTYSGSMELKDKDTLYLTGYVFVFSKTQTWKRVS